MTHDDPRHGTPAGYQAHRKDGEAACGPCRTANTEYMRSRRANPLTRKRYYQSSKAGTRALWRLAAEHRAEYERLYAEELTALRSP